MSGDPVVLVGDRGGRIRSYVSALSRFPAEPAWTVIGGFAVNVRITHVHRLTNDIDTVSRDQTKLVELLVAAPNANQLSAARLQLKHEAATVFVDVMADTAGMPLPTEAAERAFALARRLAMATSEPTDLVIVESGEIVVETTVPMATSSSLIALKAVAIARRPQGGTPEKIGSDIHDLVRLVHGCDFDIVANSIAGGGSELCQWVKATLMKNFSPDQDLRYTFARLRRLARSIDAEALTEEDLAVVADLARALPS
ncbi:nucleotidyl transferase AbiEii/AbiGii toxin family protein [Candidatus Poriferisodalis multihospitum]|uniref:nucleotidyl transferase AbiEii/AbiGii toxin family protein n=1 Tax=Candidatus Poriferisodalis multihospitum TaxID=2983191 RepID=UPI002B261B9B|nr:nucleotidyl transferase AbiEii/AbiGii toxin family protein [Candidatus Poriferisodalis multihospitum]